MLLLGLSILVLLGALAALYMEYNGHWVTNMNNHIVWGMPHIFAIFMIVTASGALNVASIASVFNKTFYQPMSRLSALLAVMFLIGGLIVLVLDLGRPDRLIVALTEYNFKSIFAWNIILYTTFLSVVIVYLWLMFERRMNKYSRRAGIGAFILRIILTSGTGAIFGFIVARQAYDSVIFAPMFVMMSLAFGLAVFLLFLLASYHFTNKELSHILLSRLAHLMGIFIAGILYFVLVYHIGYSYLAENQELSQFVLFPTENHSGVYAKIFWYGQILLGSILPLVLVYYPKFSQHRSMIGLASVLVIFGGMAQLYVLIIGGQAFPLKMFPGKEIISGYLTEIYYVPSLAEIFLGLGAMALVVLMVVLAMKILPFIPESLSDEVLNNHQD